MTAPEPRPRNYVLPKATRDTIDRLAESLDIKKATVISNAVRVLDERVEEIGVPTAIRTFIVYEKDGRAENGRKAAGGTK